MLQAGANQELQRKREPMNFSITRKALEQAICAASDLLCSRVMPRHQIRRKRDKHPYLLGQWRAISKHLELAAERHLQLLHKSGVEQ